jgi:hypothetical protein
VSDAGAIGSRAAARSEHRRDRRRAVALFALVAAFVVASFPGDFRPITTGLDPSWIYAINRLPHTEFRFGADVVFSYGPLGYLLVPVDVGSNLIQAAVSWNGIQAVTAFLMVYHFRRHRRLDAVVMFSAGSLVALSFALPYEYRILVLLGLLLSVDPADRTPWRVASAAAAVIGAGLIYAKITAGIAAVALMAGAGLVRLLQRRISGRQAAVGTVGFVAILVALGVWLTGGPFELGRWFRASWEIASGFATAMSVPQPGGLLWPGILAIAGFFAAAGLVVRGHDRLLALAGAFSLAALLTLRHAYIRHHGRLIYAVVLSALAVIALTVRTRREVAILLAGSLFVGAMAVTAFRTTGCLCTWRGQALGLEGVRNVVSLATLPATVDRLHRRTVRSLGRDRLPDDVLARVRRASGADALPEEIAFMPANGLPWVPNPSLQSYTAYTGYLDRWVAEHISGSDGPGTLLVEFVDIDGRHAMFAAPTMWRAILSNYDAVGSATGRFGEVTVLVRTVPRPMDLRAIGAVTAAVGRWEAVPPTAGLLFAEINLAPTALGRVAGLVWRIDPVMVDIRFEDGSVSTYRLIPETAQDGLLISPLPTSGAEFRALLRGGASRRVEAIRIHGPGSDAFDPSIRIVWRATPWMA